MLIASLLGSPSSPGTLILDRQPEASSSRYPTFGSGGSSQPTRGRHVGDDGDELVWSGRRVIWSRGVQVHRQYSFEREEEDVAYALFAHFPSQATPAGKGKDVDLRLSDTFGPFHTSHTAKWGSPQPFTSISSRKGNGPALVVFLQTRAHIYFPSGEDMSVHLPYVVERAWALPLPHGGVMVQRILDRRERRRLGKSKSVLWGIDHKAGSGGAMSALDELADMEDDKPRQPRLSVLMGPLEEFKAVVEGTVGFEGDGYRLLYADDIDSDRSVLFSAAEPAIVILHSRKTGQLIFTRRVAVAISSISEPAPPPSLTPRTMRPSDILAPESALARPRPSLRRNPSSFANEHRRTSGLADPLDRATRRAPRLSRAIEAHAGPGELQRTLDPQAPALPSTISKGKMKARVASSAEEKRRESGASVVMREDVDMGVRTALHRADESDLRETTMLMGLDREESVRSEVVLDRIWAWTPPEGFDPSEAFIFITDNLSPSSVVINIHSPELGQLFTFQATHHTEGDRWQISPRSLLPSLSAVPLLSTRPTVLDTLNLEPDGSLRILTSFGQSIPLTLPNSAEGDDVARKLASSLHMRLDPGEGIEAVDPVPAIVRLEEGEKGNFVAVMKNGDKMRWSADFTPKEGLARKAMEALGYAWPADAFFALKREILASSPVDEDGWAVFSRTLRRCFGLAGERVASTSFDKIVQQGVNSSDPLIARLAARHRSRAASWAHPGAGSVQGDPFLDPALIPSALMALHLVGQDCRLGLETQSDLKRVAEVVLDLAVAVGRTDWWDYWMRIAPSNTARLSEKRHAVDISLLDDYDQPPDVLSYLTRRLSRPLKSFPSPSTSFSNTSEYGHPQPCVQTQLICEIFDRLGRPSHSQPGTDTVNRAYATVQFMVERQLGVEWLADRPACIALPILEMMKLCQAVPRRDMAGGVYELIGRVDLELQRRGGADLPDQPEHDTLEGMPSVGDLMRGTVHRVQQLGLPHVRFGADRRLREVERIMQASRIRTIALENKNGSDAEVGQYQQSMVNTIAQRTLAVLVGQGIFEYGIRNTAITGLWEIPLIELSVKLSPSNTLLKAQIHGEHVDWPCFHNGVSAGLSISADCKGIDSAWIVLNKPNPLNPEHGGLLLGLGLTGHLRKLKTYHAFPYMEARHDFTSVGLLLGLAGSYAGSEDILITKTLSLHTHALLPLGSMPLNASPIVQSSALVGLGLVYAGSKNLRMAEVTLGEVGRKEMGGIDNFDEYQEAYSFSAAAAFGLIMLGRGGQAASEVDRRMLGRLRRCIHGDGPDMRKGPVPIDTTITGAGATLALGLMYLKSNRTDIRDILEIPQSIHALDLMRPDLLLMRTFARGLIMWDSINAGMSWIEEQLPSFILSQVKGHKRVGGLELATDLAYINIVAGACLAIGLKFAGTASEMAHNNLMLLFHVLSRSAGSGGVAYEAKIRRSAARQALNVVTIAICCVMSGTGELQVLRRLRISHGQEGVGVTYGTHMAMHMSVGLLFLGRGQYTLGTSNLAIAAMSIAFFPRFMHTPDDNRAYPQAFRHLWALAAEPRCLMARDVDSGETVYLPIKVKLKEGDTIRSQNLISPTLIAPFESLVSIEVDSPRYWPIVYDFTDPLHRAALVRTRTIHVKRRAGHQDYNSDPKGNRSIFIRAGGVTGFDLHYDLISPASPPSIPPAETLELVKQHSPTSYHHGVLAGLMKGDTPYERFIRTVLLECVTLDKPLVLGVYMGLMAGDRGAEGMRHVEMLKHYYAKVWDAGGTPGGGERRIALLRPAFLAALARQGGEVDEEAERAYWLDQSWGEKAEQVAGWIVSEHVPSLPLLKAFKEKVRAQGSAGADQGVLAVKVREVAKVYEANLGRVWDLADDGKPAGREGGGWKAESVGRAVSAWLA